MKTPAVGGVGRISALVVGYRSVIMGENPHVAPAICILCFDYPTPKEVLLLGFRAPGTINCVDLDPWG